MSIPEATHILYYDDDIAVPHRECLLGMFDFLERKEQFIVSGLYMQGQPSTLKCPTCHRAKHRPVIMGLEPKADQIRFLFPYTDETLPRGHIIDVHAVPAGFLLVKREVFEKIKPPWFVFNDSELLKRNKGKRVGEDIYFSLKAREAGFKLWVDTRASLLHYAPTFVGLPEDLPFAQSKTDSVVVEAQKLRAEYLEQISEDHSK